MRAHTALASILVSLVSFAVVVVGAPRAAIAAAFDLGDTGWEGMSELLDTARTELGASRVLNVSVINWAEVEPEDGVLVLHPLTSMDVDESTAFMHAGGRLALLDDYGRGDELLTRFHIERVPPPEHPVSALRNNPALAIAEPATDPASSHGQGPHPVVARVPHLVTNHPTAFRHPNLSPVLEIRAVGEPSGILAVAGQVGKGRLFAMGDPSAAMNQMLRYPGNRAFVAGLVRYLVEDDGAQRRQGRLFIVANRFGETGAFGGHTSLRKNAEVELRALAAVLMDARRDGFPAWAHVLLAAATALGLASWAWRTSTKPYRSPLPRYARPVPLVAQGGIAGRFAVISAPSSPRSLALLELKSALGEALALRFDLPAEPAPEALAKIARRVGSLDESRHSAFKDVLALMDHAEASVVAGRPVRVSRAALARAARVVNEVLAACGADGKAPHPHPLAGDPQGAAPSPPFPPHSDGAHEPPLAGDPAG